MNNEFNELNNQKERKNNGNRIIIAILIIIIIALIGYMVYDKIIVNKNTSNNVSNNNSESNNEINDNNNAKMVGTVANYSDLSDDQVNDLIKKADIIYMPMNRPAQSDDNSYFVAAENGISTFTNEQGDLLQRIVNYGNITMDYLLNNGYAIKDSAVESQVGEDDTFYQLTETGKNYLNSLAKSLYNQSFDFENVLSCNSNNTSSFILNNCSIVPKSGNGLAIGAYSNKIYIGESMEGSVSSYNSNFVYTQYNKLKLDNDNNLVLSLKAIFTEYCEITNGKTSLDNPTYGFVESIFNYPYNNKNGRKYLGTDSFSESLIDKIYTNDELSHRLFYKYYPYSSQADQLFMDKTKPNNDNYFDTYGDNLTTYEITFKKNQLNGQDNYYLYSINKAK
jgi:hypothetical protein